MIKYVHKTNHSMNRNKSRNQTSSSSQVTERSWDSRNKIRFSATGQPSQGVRYLDSAFLNGQKMAKTSSHDLKINGEKGDVPALFCHQVRSPKFRNGALARGAVTSIAKTARLGTLTTVSIGRLEMEESRKN